MSGKPLIQRYVALKVPASPSPSRAPSNQRIGHLLGIECEFFLDAARRHPAPEGGKIAVDQRAGGADVLFWRAKGESWAFHELTIHPTGLEVGEIGLNWVADREFLALRDITGKARSFNYTLSVLHDGTKIYFDPELVNIGDTGGEPGYPPPEGYGKDLRAAASEA